MHMLSSKIGVNDKLSIFYAVVADSEAEHLVALVHHFFHVFWE